MKTKSSAIADEALIKATGKAWADWKKILRSMKAGDLSHKEIASKLSTEHGVPGWWAQGITVRFEQEIGRREPGQSSTGRYNVGVSTTIQGSMDDALAIWSAAVKNRKNFDGVSIDSPPTTTSTPKWRYWKIKLKDGTRINVNISEKPGGKALLNIQHENLADSEGIERWRTFWKSFVKILEKG